MINNGSLLLDVLAMVFTIGELHLVLFRSQWILHDVRMFAKFFPAESVLGMELQTTVQEVETSERELNRFWQLVGAFGQVTCKIISVISSKWCEPCEHLKHDDTE